MGDTRLVGVRLGDVRYPIVGALQFAATGCEGFGRWPKGSGVNHQGRAGQSTALCFDKVELARPVLVRHHSRSAKLSRNIDMAVEGGDTGMKRSSPLN